MNDVQWFNLIVPWSDWLILRAVIAACGLCVHPLVYCCSALLLLCFIIMGNHNSGIYYWLFIHNDLVLCNETWQKLKKRTTLSLACFWYQFSLTNCLLIIVLWQADNEGSSQDFNLQKRKEQQKLEHLKVMKNKIVFRTLQIILSLGYCIWKVMLTIKCRLGGSC